MPVHITLSSITLTLAAGEALVPVPSSATAPIDSDAVVTCTQMPTLGGASGAANDFRTLLRRVMCRASHATAGQYVEPDIDFRIAVADYDALGAYLDDVFVPRWQNTDVTGGSGGEAMLRASTDRTGAQFVGGNALELYIADRNGVDPWKAPAPGNFDLTSHGSISDLHVGYVAAALTNAHQGRAILLNEAAVFDTLATGTAGADTFGTAFTASLFAGKSATADGQHYELQGVSKTDATSPLAQLYYALYSNAPGRFDASASDADGFIEMPLDADDTVRLKTSIAGGVRMGASHLGLQADAAATVLKAITAICATSSSPATYEKPIDYDRVPGSGGDAVTDSNIATETSAEGSVTAVSTLLRPQVYEFVLTC